MQSEGADRRRNWAAYFAPLGRRHSVVMDVTERCNLRCTMCYFSVVDRIRFEPFDRSFSPNGNMPVQDFEKIAAEYFPGAWRIALGCTAEPLIHPEFARLVRIAGRHRPAELWFPTNLLALNQEKAEAIVDAGVAMVGVSIDGIDAPTYEKIRVGGRFEQLLSKLELLNSVRRGSKTQLRVIFTLMRSNRHQLAGLPEFAAAIGAAELDIRFVTPTVGVDNALEVFHEAESQLLNDELMAAAGDAVDRGLRLAYYPGFTAPGDGAANRLTRLRSALWRIRAGLLRPEWFAYDARRRREGCAFPGRTYVIRPNGAIAPCVFWNSEPLALLQEADRPAIDARFSAVRDGLCSGNPFGSCTSCTVRRDAMYQPFGEAEPVDTRG